VREILQEIQPDLVHAMRIPYEGMVAAQANPNAPLLVSVWGNDFTLHAKSNPLMDMLTKRTLARANSLHTDCQRDLRLAYDLGFSAAKPSIVLPGAGGIDPNIFYPHAKPTADPVVINPRGFRAYVRNDTFFRAIPLVLAQKPDTRFICPAMVDESVAQEWVASLGIAHAVTLLPKLAHAAMAAQFRAAAVTVSPSTHDGTPNTLLEAMACGSFPVAGDIESVREWIISGENGLLFDPADHTALAQAILQALDDHELIIRTRKINQKHIQEQAIYPQVMTKAEDFYRDIL
jgi:glycosyltransferase involved in cell wall biosynthesis